MNTPPLLIGLTLLFWGWEVKLLPLAVVGALILELSQLIRWRWDFSETDMNRFWDLCVILFAGAAVYAYATSDVVAGPARFMPWMPVIFFPFVAATSFSAHDCVHLSTYFWLLRRRNRAAIWTTALGWFVPYWYFAVCFIAASMMNVRDIRFYVMVVLLGAWLLWMFRNRTAPAWVWIVMLAIVAVAGFYGHVGLTRLQALVEYKTAQMIGDLSSTDVDLAQTRTAIGSVGKLKLSGRIILRVRTDGDRLPPELLRKASFNIYKSAGNSATWFIADAGFASVSPGPDPTTWVFRDVGKPVSIVTISMFLSQGMGIIPVPNGLTAIEGLIAGEVQTNRCGSVRVRDTLSLARYSVKYDGSAILDATPAAPDLVVPAEELPAVRQIATELGLTGKPPAEILQRVESFFQEKFTYSSFLKGTDYDATGRTTPLSQFLLRDRAGHCEYFATATTLLLRQAGIPARYAIGFAVPEESGSDHVHLVRSRDAHAWVLAYVNGAWSDFDTTPGGWSQIEDARKSVFEPFSDFLSALRYYFTYWRYFGDRATIAKRLLWLAPLAVVWFGWRLFWKKRGIRLQKARQMKEKLQYAGYDSEFYLIAKHLSRAGVTRRDGEPMGEWVHRLETMRQPGWDIAALRDIVALHYAYRFDPQGITTEQRHELKSCVERWLTNACRHA